MGLTELTIKAAKAQNKPYKLYDGKGLFFEVCEMTTGEQKVFERWFWRGVAAGTILGLALGLVIALFIAMRPQLFAGLIY